MVDMQDHRLELEFEYGGNLDLYYCGVETMALGRIVGFDALLDFHIAVETGRSLLEAVRFAGQGLREMIPSSAVVVSWEAGTETDLFGDDG